MNKNDDTGNDDYIKVCVYKALENYIRRQDG